MFGNKKELEGLLDEMNLLRRKILVVEDHDKFIDCAKEFFENEKIKVDFAANEQEALEKIANNFYHGAILDWDPNNNNWHEVTLTAEEKGLPFIFYGRYFDYYLFMVFLDENCAKIGVGKLANNKDLYDGWRTAYGVLKEIIENPGKWREQYEILDQYALKRDEIREALEKKEAKIRARQEGDKNV